MPSDHYWRHGWHAHAHTHTHNQVAPAIAADKAGAAMVNGAGAGADAGTGTYSEGTNVPSVSKWPAASEGPRRGWRARREAREARDARDARDAHTEVAVPFQSAPAVAAPSAVLAQVSDRDEMAKIRAAVERLYADKMQGVREVQERANDKASTAYSINAVASLPSDESTLMRC